MKLNKSFKNYAKYYDFIYHDKNYDRECNFIEEIFETTQKSKKILELGCGTGSYTKILLERGYKVTAIDISGEMLEIASEKCSAKFINPKGRIPRAYPWVSTMTFLINIFN